MTSISGEDFVRAWLKVSKEGGNQGDVARILNVSRQRVSARATYMKKVGVKLPNLIGRTGKTYEYAFQSLDVDELNRIIEKAQV